MAVNYEDEDNVTAGTFSSNIEISRLGSQLRKLVFGGSYPHSESGITDDDTDFSVADENILLSSSQLASDLNLVGTNDVFRVKVKADSTTGDPDYYEWDGTLNAGNGNWKKYDPQFISFRLADVGMDFGTGSDRLQVKDSSKLAEQLMENPEKVKALFAEATATAFDNNTNADREYQGISYALDDFLGNFLNGDQDSGYKGAYKAHVDSLRSQNKRIDDRIEDMDRYLEQRENVLRQSFIRMEEMQSKLNTQMQTLQNSFAGNRK